MKSLVKHPAVSALLAALLGRYLAFALGTTRWTVHGTEHLAPHIAGEPAIVAFWHECLPMMPALLTYARAQGATMRIHVLVSRHRDGRIIGEIIKRFTFDVLYGSSIRGGQDKGGASGVRAMVAALAGGDHVGITPDGPRGPRRYAAPGVAQIAALSGAKVMPCAARSSRCRVLATWDRMLLPLPFGRGVIVIHEAIAVLRDGAAAALPEIVRAMTDAAAQAERLVAAPAR